MSVKSSVSNTVNGVGNACQLVKLRSEEHAG